MPVAVNVDRDSARIDAVDPRHEGGGLATRGSDADGAAVAGDGLVADIDVIVGGGDVDSGFAPDGDVVAPGGVLKRVVTAGRVVAAGGVEE